MGREPGTYRTQFSLVIAALQPASGYQFLRFLLHNNGCCQAPRFLTSWLSLYNEHKIVEKRKYHSLTMADLDSKSAFLTINGCRLVLYNPVTLLKTEPTSVRNRRKKWTREAKLMLQRRELATRIPVKVVMLLCFQQTIKCCKSLVRVYEKELSLSTLGGKQTHDPITTLPETIQSTVGHVLVVLYSPTQKSRKWLNLIIPSHQTAYSRSTTLKQIDQKIHESYIQVFPFP